MPRQPMSVARILLSIPFGAMTFFGAYFVGLNLTKKGGSVSLFEWSLLLIGFAGSTVLTFWPRSSRPAPRRFDGKPAPGRSDQQWIVIAAIAGAVFAMLALTGVVVYKTVGRTSDETAEVDNDTARQSTNDKGRSKRPSLREIAEEPNRRATEANQSTPKPKGRQTSPPSSSPPNLGPTASPPKPSATPPKPLPELAPRSAPSPAESSLFAHVEATVKQGHTLSSQQHGRSDEAFVDVPEVGALLIGLDVVTGKFFDDTIIRSVRPLYWSREGTKVGAWRGNADGQAVRIEAKPGYAVGGLNVRAGLGVVNLSLVFMRVTDRRLDPTDRYETPPIGGSSGGSEREMLGGDGRPVVGIHGMSSRPDKQEGWIGIGLVTIAPKPAPPLTEADETSFFARIQQAVREEKTVDSEMLGRGNVDYRDVPPGGALLVGLEVTIGKFIDSETIRSVKPVYRTRTGVVDGKWQGTTEGKHVRMVAKPGYAVGGLKIRAGLGIANLRIVFMRITTAGLNPNDSYESERPGGMGGGDMDPLVNDGSLVVGIHGMSPDDPRNVLCGLGLVTIPGDPR